ncbi:uncharacterized protein ACB057_009262 [Neosynchiropus ocellatus]
MEAEFCEFFDASRSMNNECSSSGRLLAGGSSDKENRKNPIIDERCFGFRECFQSLLDFAERPVHIPLWSSDIMKIFWGAVVFLWLVCVRERAEACPAACTCYQRRAEVVCNEVPLSEYPSDLPENTLMLTIQFTNITSISERHLNATPQLRELHLFSNRLNSLSPHLLRGVPRLTVLDLTGNKLTHLPAEVFSHAPLHSLVLKNNLIEDASPDWLPENSTLTWLDLSGNQLKKMPSDLLQKLPQLENLDLSNNRLEMLPIKSLDSLTKLERLNLQNNKLESLDASVFASHRNLTYLYLTRNKLSQLPADIFQQLSQLKLLSLDNNRLSRIPAGLLDSLKMLDEEGLDLTNNPWLCDGELKYLWRWMLENKEKVFLPQTVTCAEPESLKSRAVESLKESEL